MISRRPMWMLLVSCALLSQGFSTMALAASGKDGHGSHETSLQGELLLSQATDSSGEPGKAARKAVDRPTLGLGSNGPLVIQVQILLQEQGLYRGTINGDFNTETVKAVKDFQTGQGLEPTGSVDNSTWGPLTGELETPNTAAAETETSALEAESSNSAPDSKLRLLIAVAALVGLGAGGFGLWKMLSVAVPQPLAYPDARDEDDDYMDDDFPGGKSYLSQATEPRRGDVDSHDVSPITIPAALAVQSSKALQPMSQSAQDFEEEMTDFSALEEVNLPEATGQIPDIGKKSAAEESPEGETSPTRSLARAKPSENLPVKKPAKPIRNDIEEAAEQRFAEAQFKALKQKQQEESQTDTAVEIATQTARAAALSQSSTARTTTPAAQPKTAKGKKVASAQSQSRPAKATNQGQSSNLSKTRSAKPGRKKARRVSPTPPPPPPAPSEIVRTASTGAIEQPELATTPLQGRVDIVETLITDLQGADPTKRRKAIWELGQRCDSRAIQPLVNMMTNSDSRQRSLILATLSEIGTQTLKPMKQALAISLQDENAEVRKNAIRDLTRIYDLVAQISHLLQSALEDPEPEVQDTARWALKQLNRIRSNAGLEGSSDQPILQQSVSPPESFSGKGTFQPRSLPKT